MSLFCRPNSLLFLSAVLTMPAVTVLFSWNGLPIATTHSPGRRSEESPSFKVGKFVWKKTKNTEKIVGMQLVEGWKSYKYIHLKCMRHKLHFINNTKLTAFIRTVARSDTGSTACTMPSNVLPSFSLTLTLTLFATTWALVSTRPSSWTIKPEPLDTAINWPVNGCLQKYGKIYI